MKKYFYLTFIFFVFYNSLIAQKINEDEYIAYLKTHSESQFKSLFESNGYTLLSFQEKYPTCLEGYTFYTDYCTQDNITKFHDTYLTAKIKNGGIFHDLGTNSTGCKEIVYTLTARDRLGSDCLIFIGSAGLIYVYSLFRFEKPVPVSLTVGGFSLVSNKVTTGFIFGMVTDNDIRDNNKIVDFKAIAAKTQCSKTITQEAQVTQKVTFDIKSSTNTQYNNPIYDTKLEPANKICNEFIVKKDINGLMKFLETKPDINPVEDLNWSWDYPLMEAIYLERTEMILILLKYGADPNVAEDFVSSERSKSLTELIASKFSDYPDIDTVIPQLLEHGLKADPENLGNLLFFAINFQHLKSVILLVEKGADLNLVFDRDPYKTNKKTCKQLGLQSKNEEIKAYFKQLNKKK